METLPYQIADFPFQQAQHFLRRRAQSKWITRLVVLGSAFWAFALLLILNTALNAYPGLFLAKAFPAISLCIGFALMLLADRLFQRKTYAAMKAAPFRARTFTLSQAEDGLTIRSSHGHTTYPWAHILDVIEGPGGVLILLSPVDFAPIPSAAFPDPAQMQHFITGAKVQLFAAKGPQP